MINASRNENNSKYNERIVAKLNLYSPVDRARVFTEYCYVAFGPKSYRSKESIEFFDWLKSIGVAFGE